MNRLVIVAIVLLTMIPGASPQVLASLVDRNRVLLIFAPTDHDPALLQQLTFLNHHAAEMRDRDIVVIPILSQSGPPTSANTLRTLNPPLITDAEQLTTRNRFHVPPTEFALILLGKDGDEKLRSTVPITIERINATIDAMPMRQDEIRKRSKL